MRAMVEVTKIRELLGDDDAQLVLDTIEGQTFAIELLDRIVEHVMADEALVRVGTERLKRLETRAEKWRNVATHIIQKLPAPYSQKLERPLYTASVRYHQGVTITDESLLPHDFFNKPTPDRRHIASFLNKGNELPGAELSNARPILTLRKE